jgi:hypothetical protein
MNRTLPIASHDFVSAISRHTEGSDLPRLVGVFDALLAWSAARSAQLAFRADGGRTEVICFERVGQDSGSKSVFWSAQVTRGRARSSRSTPRAAGHSAPRSGPRRWRR